MQQIIQEDENLSVVRRLRCFGWETGSHHEADQGVLSFGFWSFEKMHMWWSLSRSNP